MPTVLVVDDDDTVGTIVADYLTRAGHRTHRARDGVQALRMLGSEAVDLVILDVMLPGLDGLEVCRRARRSRPTLPIIMLTALGEAEDRIAGLELGADDYVTKPFSPRELVLRVDSVLRRARRSDAAPDLGAAPLAVGSIEIDVPGRLARRDGEVLNLTAREFDLLVFLVAHPGVAYTREQLMSAVWGWSFGDTSTVTVHVRRLREKVEHDPASPMLIRTAWGIGYRLDPSWT